MARIVQVFGSGFCARAGFETKFLGRIVHGRLSECSQQSSAVFVQGHRERAALIVDLQRVVRLPVCFESRRVGIDLRREATESTTIRVEEPRAVSRLDSFHEADDDIGSGRKRKGQTPDLAYTTEKSAGRKVTPPVSSPAPVPASNT